MINELRKKFIYINMLLVTLVLLIVFSIVCIGSYRQLSEETDAVLNMVIGWRTDQKPPRFHIGEEPPPDFTRDLFFIVSVSNSGEIRLIHTENISVEETDLPDIIHEITTSGETSGVVKKYNLRFLRRDTPHEIKIAFVELSGQQAVIRNTIFISLLSGALAFLAFFAISVFLSKWVLRPLERSWQQQQQFLADASHELKTPLTVILANTNILKAKGDETISQQISWIKSTEEEAKRMKQLVDDMLFLAKSDSTKVPTMYSEVNLSDVITNAILTFEAVAFECSVLLDYTDIDPGININGDENQIKQLMGILLDNAVKFSEKGKTVFISLKVKQGKSILSVHNVGNVIPEYELTHIFERFYRADKARSNEGYGLGLSIAKSIVDSHNGRISAESSMAYGTIFRVYLPIC